MVTLNMTLDIRINSICFLILFLLTNIRNGIDAYHANNASK